MQQRKDHPPYRVYIVNRDSGERTALPGEYTEKKEAMRKIHELVEADRFTPVFIVDSRGYSDSGGNLDILNHWPGKKAMFMLGSL